MPAGYGKAPQHIEAEVSVYDALGLEEKMALRAVALKRAKEMGGRPLVSGILVDLPSISAFRPQRKLGAGQGRTGSSHDPTFDTHRPTTPRQNPTNSPEAAAPNVKDCTLVRFLALQPEALWCRGAVSSPLDRLLTV